MNVAEINKAIENVKLRYEKRQNMLLRQLTSNQIWNEFSNSNHKLPEYLIK